MTFQYNLPIYDELHCNLDIESNPGPLQSRPFNTNAEFLINKLNNKLLRLNCKFKILCVYV